MAEKKGVGHAYNVDFLNVVFAASSLFLFLSVVWMVWDDYDREWKNTQRQFARLEYQVTQAQLQQTTRSVDRNKLQQLEGQLKTAQQSVAANQQKVGATGESPQSLDLPRDLGSAEDRGEGPRGIEQLRELPHLFLHQETSALLAQQPGYAHNRGVRAMRGAESVVDVTIGERRELLGELGIVAFLARMKAQVLEKQDVAVGKAGDGPLDLLADAVIDEADRP